MFYPISALQNPPSAIHQETSDRGVTGVFRQIQFKVLVGVAHTQHTIQKVCFTVSSDLLASLFIIFIVYLPNDLFEQIFEREDTFHAAVFIDYKDEMNTHRLHLP